MKSDSSGFTALEPHSLLLSPQVSVSDAADQSGCMCCFGSVAALADALSAAWADDFASPLLCAPSVRLPGCGEICLKARQLSVRAAQPSCVQQKI